MIKLHSTGAAVKDWQSFLIQQGFLHDKADGIFGKLTKAATEAFQAQKGLSVDGIVGKMTLQKAEQDGYVPPKVTPVSSGFPPPNTINAIFDISHHNSAGGHILDFEKAKAAGMIAVFHKATEGLTLPDDKYQEMKQKARAAGLLWGAYHFGHMEDGAAQADYFLSMIGDDDGVLPVLDFERPAASKKRKKPLPPMTVDQAIAFCDRIKEKRGKYPGLYGGSLIKDDVGYQNVEKLANSWLWLSEYGSRARLPKGWNTWTFWQFTDGNIGPDTQPVPGIGPADRELFNGDEAQLRQFWEQHMI